MFNLPSPSEANLLEEDPLERAPEVLVEDGVDDGVEGRVGVAQPEGEGEARALHLPASRRREIQNLCPRLGEFWVTGWQKFG